MWTMNISIFAILCNHCLTSDMGRVVAVADSGSSQVLAIVHQHRDPFVPLSAAEAIYGQGRYGRKGTFSIRRRIAYPADRNEDDAAAQLQSHHQPQHQTQHQPQHQTQHQPQHQTQHQPQHQTQLDPGSRIRYKASGPAEYTIRHVYIVKMMPSTMSSEEILREAQIPVKNSQSHQASTNERGNNNNNNNYRQKNQNVFDVDSETTVSHIRNGRYRDSDLNSALRSRDDHFLAESRNQLAQIIILPAPIHHSPADVIKNSHDSRSSSSSSKQRLHASQEQRAAASDVDVNKRSRNTTGFNENRIVAWKAHPEVFVIHERSRRQNVYQ